MICRVCIVSLSLIISVTAFAQNEDAAGTQSATATPPTATTNAPQETSKNTNTKKSDKKNKAKREQEKVSEMDTKSDQAKDVDKLMYPELEVTPRASQRIEIEARKEKNDRWSMHLPLQLSALATIYVSTNAKKADDLTADEKQKYDDNVLYASTVGYGWLIGTIGLSALYRPYKSGFNEISRLKGGSMRADLTKERLAEEALKSPAEVGKKMLWFSVASHLYVNLSLVSYVDHDSKINCAIGTAFALIPLLFENHWSETYDRHREYKKKIYGPVSGIIPYQRDGQISPLYSLTWAF